MVAATEAESKALAQEIQKVAMEKVPFVTVGHFFLPTAYRATLKGVLGGPVPWFWNIEKA